MDNRIEENLYRIIDGQLEYDDHSIKDPVGKVKLLGKKTYIKTLKSCFDLISDRDNFIFLCKIGKWDKDKEKRLKEIPIKLDKKKIEYFNNFFNPLKKGKIKTELDSLNIEYNDLVSTKNLYFNFTPIGIATGAMWRRMMFFTYEGENKFQALSYYHSKNLDNKDIRDVALCNDWLSYYTVSNQVFGSDPFLMTDYQRDLIHWSKVYENIRSHPDCPPDVLIADHDAFDGWMSSEQQKREKNKKKEKISGGISENARNVFVVTPPESVEEIYELNDQEGKARINSMYKELNEKGNMKDQEFTVNRILKE